MKEGKDKKKLIQILGIIKHKVIVSNEPKYVKGYSKAIKNIIEIFEDEYDLEIK